MILGYLPEGPVNPALVDALIQQRGLNDPLFFQFLSYLGDALIGNWGISSTIARGMPVIELLKGNVPRVFEVLFLPICAGVGLGYFFGRISNRSERNWLKNLIQILSGLFLAIPVFFFGMILQFTLGYINPIFPSIGYKNVIYPNPPFITGSRIFDSLISGQFYLAMDTLYHYALPMIILTVAIIALTTRMFSSKMTKDSYKKKTLLSRTAKTSAGFGVILTYFIMVDLTFNLGSIGQVLLQGIYNMDFFVLQGVLFVILILLTITIFVSNLVFSLYRLRKDILPGEELAETTERVSGVSGKEDLKNYLKQIVKSPIAIIGLVAVLVPVIISIFPELVSGSTLEEARGIYVGPWEPPSPEHLLGTAKFGRDVLALTVYGIQEALLFGGVAVLVGLIGGLIFGLLANKFDRVFRTITRSVMLVFYVLPGIALVMLFELMLGQNFGLIALITGLLLIPSFTRIIANAEFRIVPIAKKIIAYLPLFAGFAILLYETIGFLGFSDNLTIQLGDLISEGRAFMYIAPWAIFWPGFAIFFVLISLFVLHEGLTKRSRSNF
jgi:ABC-type dipeptide/oligopeptide/nickel transport system permease component